MKENYYQRIKSSLRQSESFLYLLGFVVIAFTYFAMRYSLVYNVAISDCLNSRLFIIDKWDTRMYEGQLVAFEMNIETEFYGTGDIWVKKIAAIGPKTVSVDENAVQTDAQYFPLSASYVLEKLNKTPEMLIPQWNIGDEELFMIGETLTSLDSRFWGPINRLDVKGRAYAIL